MEDLYKIQFWLVFLSLFLSSVSTMAAANQTKASEEKTADNPHWLGKSPGEAFCLRDLLIALPAPTSGSCNSTHCCCCLCCFGGSIFQFLRGLHRLIPWSDPLLPLISMAWPLGWRDAGLDLDAWISFHAAKYFSRAHWCYLGCTWLLMRVEVACSCGPQLQQWGEGLKRSIMISVVNDRWV